MINADERDKKLEKLENYKIKTNQYSKRYNPVNIRPAINEPIQKKINREMELFKEIKKNYKEKTYNDVRNLRRLNT